MMTKKSKRAGKTAKLSSRYKTCQKTLHFKTLEEAQVSADSYNERVLFADMNAYHCDRHSCWHIGHYNKYRVNQNTIQWT